MGKDQQEALQWFVDFGNMDIETIKPGDKAKLLIEAEDYLFPVKEIAEFQDSPIPLFKRIKEDFAWAFSLPGKESEAYWPTILHLQEVVKKHLWGFIPSTDYITSIGYQKIATRIVWGSKRPFKITYLSLTENHDEYVRFKIFKLLENFSGHAIRVCPGCKKFFFNPTRRKKDFCGPRCMWRVIAGKRRKELKERHPKKYKAYLDKQSEVMRQRYEKNQHSKGYKKITHYKRKK